MTDEANKLVQPRWSRSLRRIAATVSICLAVAVSLLTFPSAVPWMIAGWLVGFCLLMARSRPGWAPLAACLAIVLVKRVDWPPGLWALAVVLAVVAAMQVAGQRGVRLRQIICKQRLAIAACLWSAWLAMAWNWHEAGRGPRRALAADRPIVCLGDSLTSGMAPDGGYVPLLAKLVTVPVIDLSREGITTEQALKRLPEMIAARPQAVVIELGGHDFLKGYSRTQTKSQLKKLVDTARQLGAQPILWEVPRGFMIDPYAGLERELAREEDLELISDTAVRQLVISSPVAPPGMWTGGPYLSDDGLHPNALGNELLARNVAIALRHVFGDEIVVHP